MVESSVYTYAANYTRRGGELQNVTRAFDLSFFVRSCALTLFYTHARVILSSATRKPVRSVPGQSEAATLPATAAIRSYVRHRERTISGRTCGVTWTITRTRWTGRCGSASWRTECATARRCQTIERSAGFWADWERARRATRMTTSSVARKTTRSTWSEKTRKVMLIVRTEYLNPRLNLMTETAR